MLQIGSMDDTDLRMFKEDSQQKELRITTSTKRNKNISKWVITNERLGVRFEKLDSVVVALWMSLAFRMLNFATLFGQIQYHNVPTEWEFVENIWVRHYEIRKYCA